MPNQATESQVALFRTAIALVWADHNLDAGERDQMLVYIERNIHLSDAQREQLRRELEQATPIDTAWAAITDAQDRARLLDLAPVLCSADENFCPLERELYDKLYAEHMRSIDQAGTEAEIKLMAEAFRLQHAAEAKAEAQRVMRLGPVAKFMHYAGKLIG